MKPRTMWMPERRRFRARYTDWPGLTVGERHVFEPGAIIEDWSMGPRCRPNPVEATDPRPGTVLMVTPPRPEIGRPWWDVMAEDPAPLESTVGAVLTVLGPRILTDPDTLRDLIDHLAHGPQPDDAARAAVANAVAPWLRERFPDLSRALNRIPSYNTPAQYGAWLDGLCAGRYDRDRVLVPAPPFILIHRPDPMPSAAPLDVRPDAVNRLWGNRREN